MRAGDWPEVRAVYLEGIATGDATFEQTAPEWEKWDAEHLASARLVARSRRASLIATSAAKHSAVSQVVARSKKDGELLGWAALSPVSRRSVYAGVAEVSLYVAERARGAGVGTQLMARLIAESEAAGIWTLQAGIFPENIASIALHQRAGFRVVGSRERLGQMNGRWRDVVLLERRSSTVGRLQ